MKIVEFYNYHKLIVRVNNKLFAICALDVIDDFDITKELLLDVLNDITRLVPYSYNKRSQAYEFCQGDGVGLIFNKNYTDKLKKVFITYLDIFADIKTMRNKLEHSEHKIKINSSSSGSLSYPIFSYKVIGENRKKIISIKAKELIDIIKELNCLYESYASFILSKNKRRKNIYKLFDNKLSEFNKVYDNFDELKIRGFNVIIAYRNYIELLDDVV